MLHLDHSGDSFELQELRWLRFLFCHDWTVLFSLWGKHCLDKESRDYAHKYDVTVEGELGVLAGVEDEVASEVSTKYKARRSDRLRQLLPRCWFIGYLYRYKPRSIQVQTRAGTRDPKTGRPVPPPLAFDVLDVVMEKLPGFQSCFTQFSSVPQEYVDIINANGGKLPGCSRYSRRATSQSSQERLSARLISTLTLNLAFTAAARKTFAEKPALNSTHVNTVDQLVTSWSRCTSTRL